jgi:peptidoglycan/xylan/chitin deacetylase (PgdA/CDA1 family)
MNKKRLLNATVLGGTIVFMLLFVLGCGGSSTGIKLEPDPNYVESRIIFRMDDAALGLREQVVEQIIRVFEQNKVPIDVGVIAFDEYGQPKYELPFLKEFFDAGVIGISMHGYSHVPNEFNTAISKNSYEDLKSNLVKARELFKNYYGVTPIAITVPYNFFDEDGYRAAQDAGFKMFCTSESEDNHPSALPVDYSGNRAENGMIRLCTMDDIAFWNEKQKKWRDLFLSDSAMEYAIERGFKKLGVSVISIHPETFADENGNSKPEKLARLDQMIKLSLKHNKITTFRKWYERFAHLVRGAKPQK